MSSTTAFPYRTAPPEFCSADPWEIENSSSDWISVGGGIPGWDYDSEIKLRRSLTLQPRSLLESIGLGSASARMTLVVTCETGSKSYRWTAYRCDIPDSEDWRHDMELVFDSTRLAHRIYLHTDVVLATEVRTDTRFTPTKLGSRLFRSTQLLELEGTLGRFPMDMMDFGDGLSFLRAPDALWYLDWDPARPESQFLGTVLLYINSAQTQFANLVQASDPMILSLLRCDVIRTMCGALVRSDDFAMDFGSYDPETVGGQVRDWLIMAFDDANPDVLRSQLENTPGRFEARIQDTFR